MNDSFSLQVPKFENPFERNDHLSDLEKYISDKLREDGFCVIDFPEENVEDLANNLIKKLTKHFMNKSSNKEQELGQRLQDAFQVEEVKRIASNTTITDLLTNVYGRRAFPFQTLNFSSGTQQGAHSDHIHFDSIPQRFMAGVWLALEDIDEENGAIFYYPGSHKWPALYNSEVEGNLTDGIVTLQNRFTDAWEAYAKFYGVEKQYFHAKKGQCLIWSSNLVHGGGRHINTKRTRWSQVTHYYFDECAYYTPLLSSPHTGIYYWRNIKDLITGKTKSNVVNGINVSGRTVSLSSEGFNPKRYLELNPDVKEAGVDPYRHFLEFGVKENRRFS